MFKNFSITCERANEICNKAQYGEASFIEKLKLNWHILFCKICALYTKQNQTLTKVCQSKIADEKEKKVCLTDDEKQLLKEKMKNQIS